MKAIISECGQYRYCLGRKVGESDKVCLFVMLNPSIADAEIDDPTIKKCIKYAQREMCGQLAVINLFSLRATDPDKLLNSIDPFGPDHDVYLTAFMDQMKPEDLLIFAWGSHKSVTSAYRDQMLSMARKRGLKAFCLGINKDGNPKHPLYIRDDQKLIEMNGESENE